jgi:small subunit ribosomal protein S13
MVRISGVDLPAHKRIDIALTYLYGIGRRNVVGVVQKAAIDPAKLVVTLTDEETARIQRAVDTVKVEGDLRREVLQHISRLKEIGSYRGIRHAKNLPVHGQRTRTNARTKRGKRMTIGALKKEELAKKETAVKIKEQTAATVKGGTK